MFSLDGPSDFDPQPIDIRAISVELVGRVEGYTEVDRERRFGKDQSQKFMSFLCTNGEVFDDILIPPYFKDIPEHMIRIFVHRSGDALGALGRQRILNHWEEM